MMNTREAIERGDVAALEGALVSDPASRDAVIQWGPGGRNHCHPLHYICDKFFDGTLDSTKSSALARVLIAAGADLDFQNGDPLIAAASLGPAEVAFELLDAGARNDLRAPGGETALHWAAYVGTARLVERLIRAGAPLDVRDRQWNGTPLDWALHGWKTAPVAADGGGHQQSVLHLLKAGAPSGPRDPKRWSVAPYFIVDDVVETAAFYRDKLGFQFDRLWGDPPAFCMVRRGGVTIMLSDLAKKGVMHPNRLADPEAEAWDAYVWVDDADALYAEFKSKGVKIVRDLCDQPYGNRDFDIVDCNGYRLCFGHSTT